MIKKFKIFENQINILKTSIIKVKRYCSSLTEKTDILRGGTWYSYINDNKADRYNQKDYQLGGDILITGKIKYKQPYILTNTNTHYVLSDFQIFSYITIFTESDKDILFDILDAKNKKELIKISKKISLFNDNTLKIIEKQSEFNIANIITDKILSVRLKENNFDIFIRLDENNDIFEIFDINNFFIKD